MTLDSSLVSPRRSFLARLAAATAAFGLGTAPAHASEFTSLAQDEPWMKKLTGTQKVIFHAHEPTGGLPLRWAETFLNTQKNVYGKKDEDSTVVVGLNGKAVGLLFNDAMWAKYPVAQVMAMNGTTNPAGPSGSNQVAQLLARGVIILACRNALNLSGQRFLPEAQRGDAAARAAFGAEVTANLLAGIDVVPAMVTTLQMAQDRGCRYVYAGG
jgi:intracellular sulfur oxidation DsrE/DsrF family protein